jgi:aryl-alcohol dehydrogenase-like predicted oxidoreductase
MRYRSFGRTGWQVSEIGFGAWQLGGDWGKVDDAHSIDTLHYAFDRGINFVDTAELYGNGHSETVIGQALKTWNGSKIYVASKVRPIQWPEPNDKSPQMRGRFPEWYVRENVERSLKRLGVERIDLYQMHSFMPSAMIELDWLETLHKLQREGKIDRVGVSLRDYEPEEGVDAAECGLVDSFQVIFNMFEQRPAQQLFQAGKNSNVAFIARVPLDSGSLVGNWNASSYEQFETGSQQFNMFRGERFVETLKRVQALKDLCTPYYATLAETAMRYILSESRVSTLIPGMKNRGEVDMNIAYCDGAEFPLNLKQKLPHHIWIRNYYN